MMATNTPTHALLNWVTGCAVATALWTAPAAAHPHVYIGGGVDFVLRDGTMLETLEVTWVYDAFETLYILSFHDLSLNEDGALDEEDRLELVRQRSDWPEDFDGSAHLSLDGQLQNLEWPEDLDAHLIDGQLTMTFTRKLSEPLDLSQTGVEVGFYESTYFFAFSISQEPKLLGNVGPCTAEVIQFDPTEKTATMKKLLARLSREETPTDTNVGANFADRIALTCD